MWKVQSGRFHKRSHWKWTWKENIFWCREIYLDKELEQKHGLTFSQSTSQRNSTISQCWAFMPRKRRGEYRFDPFGWLDSRRRLKVHQWNLSPNKFDSRQIWHQCEQDWEDWWWVQFPAENYKLEVDRLWNQPGNYIQQMLKAYEVQTGKIKLQQLPSDNSKTRWKTSQKFYKSRED